MSIKVKITHFSGAGKVSDRTKSGLAAIIRDILIQNAQTKVWGASLSSFTDNSTGTASIPATTPSSILPPVNTATASLGEATTSFNTSLGKIENATAVYVATLNKARQLLGLPLLTYAQGAVASANTIPALDLAGTGAAVGSTVDWASATAACRAVQQNIYQLKLALNEVLVAIGQPAESGANVSSIYPFTTLEVVGTATSSAAGLSSMLVTDVTAFLAAVANDFATLALMYNDYVPAMRTVALTDSTGGTSASALAANALPAPAVGAATTSAPKAGFDTQLGVIRNAISSMASAYNALVLDSGNPPGYVITDSTGGTVSTTLAAISASLTAVDGSSGTNAVDEVSALAAMATIDNSLSSLGFYASKLASTFEDVAPLGTDALGGTVSATLAAVASTTATGVGGGSGAITLLDTAVDTWLAGTKNNISTIAALLNAMNTMTATTKPLLVIAG